MKLSILIPVFNEQASVEEIVRRVAGMDLSKIEAHGVKGENVELEIIAVDDCSADASQGILTRLHGGPAEAPGEGPRTVSDAGAAVASGGGTAPVETIAGLRFIQHPFNQGKGAAIRTALAAATGDYCIIQDADFEYDPEDVPRLLEPVVEGRAKVVYGARPLDGSGGRWVMDFGNRALTVIGAAAQLRPGV